MFSGDKCLNLLKRYFSYQEMVKKGWFFNFQKFLWFSFKCPTFLDSDGKFGRDDSDSRKLFLSHDYTFNVGFIFGPF